MMDYVKFWDWKDWAYYPIWAQNIVIALVIIVVVSLCILIYIKNFVDHKNRWSKAKSMTVPRSRFCTAKFDGKIFAIGGRNSNGILQTVEVFNPIEDKWEFRSDLNVARSGHSCAVLGREIFVFGGVKPNLEHERSIEKYNVDDDDWEIIGSLPRDYNGASSIADTFNNRIYIFAGGPNTVINNKVIEFNPETNNVSEYSQGGAERMYHQSLFIGGVVYNYGGTNDKKNYFEKYIIPYKTFQTIPKKEPLLHMTSGAYLRNIIYIFGGIISSNVKKISFTYNVEKEKWKRIQDMPTGRAGSSSVVINNKIYVLGGEDNRGHYFSLNEVFTP